MDRHGKEATIGANEEYLLDQLEQWVHEGLITPEQHTRLRARYAAPAADTRRQIVVSATLATGGVLLLLGVVWLLRDLRLGPVAITFAQAALAVICLVAGWRMHQARPYARGGRTLLALAAAFYLGALGLGSYALDVLDRANAPWLLLAGGSGVGLLGWLVRSLKLHALGVGLVAIAGGIWLHRAGMPIEYAVMSVAGAVAAIGLAADRRLPEGFALAYLAGGLSVGALMAWFLEVTTHDAARWPYALMLTGWAAAALALGFKREDDVLAGLGIGLVVLDIYTQYYTLFWNWAPRTVFFLLGGLLTLGFGLAYERTLHGARPSALWERLRGKP